MYNRKLHFFDICGTLYRSNTTYDFLLFYFKRNNRLKYIKFKLCFTFQAKLIWKVMSMFKMRRWIRNYLIGFIKNESLELINSEASLFVNSFLKEREIANVCNALIKANSDSKNEVWLVSASIFPVVNAIAIRYNISNFMATNLEVEGGYFTGTILNDLEGTKDQKIKKDNIIKPTDLVFVYTDSKEDINLVLLSKKSFIVGNIKNENYWKSRVSNQIEIKFLR